MKVGKFVSKYLRAEDIKRSGDAEVTVVTAEAEEVGSQDKKSTKLVLYFEELEQGLVTNKTTIATFTEGCDSDDSDDWIGAKAVLYFDPNVAFQGKRCGGIRVRDVVPPKKVKKAKK